MYVTNDHNISFMQIRVFTAAACSGLYIKFVSSKYIYIKQK